MGRIAPTSGSGEIAARMRERRGGTLRPVDEALLHSPEIADGWNLLLGALRSRISLSAEVRELAILRIAYLNLADYEWVAHEPEGRRAGLSASQMAALRTAKASEADVLSERQRLIVAYTDSMTTMIRVPDELFASISAMFTVTEVVELTAVIAAYNMVSRVLVALEVDLPEAT
jgi:4-carboxymuconolactone decarboxylase